MPRTLKRRSDAISRDDSPSTTSTPQPPQAARVNQKQHNARRRPQSPPSGPDDSSGEESSSADPTATQAPADTDSEEDATQTTTHTQHQTLVKKLVRLALASEYARQPLRRNDVSVKLFKESGVSGRSFKAVFRDAQVTLERVFGMKLVGLPGREKVGLKERRREVALRNERENAGKTKKRGGGRRKGGLDNEDEDGIDRDEAEGEGGGSSHATGRGKGKGKADDNPPGSTTTATASNSAGKSWILVSTLPARYKNPSILSPAHAPTEPFEASYTALYTFLISLIYLNAGELNEGKLERYLDRVNINSSGKTEWGMWEKVLSKLVREGYLDRRREDGEGWVYTVGPRGKVEVGVKGVEGLVRGVYYDGGGGPAADGEEADQTDAENSTTATAVPKMELDELNRRLKRSLGVSVGVGAGTTNTTQNEPEQGQGQGQVEEAMATGALGNGGQDEQRSTRRRSGRRRAAAGGDGMDDDR